ncbi:MAG: polymer-forming cytoskeletal protein [Lachnospiraceae bacterium]|nr:polymer-forming cytoskeletal protein [Lachnospiraceae bacterium]
MMEAATGAESYEMPVQSDPVEPIAEPMEDPEQSLEVAMAMGDAIDAAFADLEAFGEAGAAEEPEAAETAQEAAISAAADLTEPQMAYSAENNYKGAEKSMDSSNEKNYSEETSVITGGVVLDGNLTTEGSLDLLGTVNGNLSVGGKLNVTGGITGNSNAREIFAENAKICGDLTSDSAIKIGEGTVIIGNITALSAAIAGAVKGDIDVHGPVILDATAIVMGNIKSKSVQINNGATLEGNCSQCYADVSPTSFFDEYKPAQKKADKSDKSDKEKASK